jgi:hypothetical protein|tara:strand:+ start:1075 stop:1344 length:270 start_codon:yes stop_codon:yes gene_type:complete
MDDLVATLGGIVALLALLGALGSVSVLYHRVRQLETANEQMHQRVSEAERLLHEVSNALATIQADLRWIRRAVSQFDPSAAHSADADPI